MFKFRRLATLFMTFALMAAIAVPAYASNLPEGLTDDQIMEHIMQGNGYYLGDGAPVSEFDYLLPQTRWSSGNGATHQYVTTYGLSILQNERSAAYNWLKGLESLTTIIENADWPDSAETDGITFRGHFYYQDGSQPSPNALSRFTQHYENAISYYEDGQYKFCFQELGRALHYLEDASCPVHVSLDFYATPSHALYENYVNSHLSSYTASSGGRYTYMSTSHSYENIFESVSSYAYSYLPEDSVGSGANLSASYTVPRAMQNVAGLLYRFYSECH